MAQFTKVGGVVLARGAEKVSLLRRLWNDDCGALLATEWVVVATIIVLGIIPGLIAIRQGTLSELIDFSHATTSLDQSYGFTGQVVGCDPNAADPNAATDDADLRSTLTPTGAAAIRTGATPTDATGKAVRADRLHRGGVQGFTAGSSFVEKHNFDGSDKAINLRSTPANGASADDKPCN